jgi:hypothetical protein
MGVKLGLLTLREEHSLKLFEERVLRILGPKGDEGLGDWNKLHNEELHNLYYSFSLIRTIKSRWIRWAGHVARMGRRALHMWYWWESQNERDH